MFPDTPEHRSSAVTCQLQGQNEDKPWSGVGQEGRGLGDFVRLRWPSAGSGFRQLGVLSTCEELASCQARRAFPLI